MIRETGKNNGEEVMMNQALKKAIEHWDYIAPVASYPKNKKEFEKLQTRLDELLDLVGNDENHPMIGLIDIMSDLIAAYEADHYRQPRGSGIDALKYLMDSHHLCQHDLPEIGSQGVVSEILGGKRSLNLRQIKKLAKRFHIDPATFIDK